MYYIKLKQFVLNYGPSGDWGDTHTETRAIDNLNS